MVEVSSTVIIGSAFVGVTLYPEGSLSGGQVGLGLSRPL